MPTAAPQRSRHAAICCRALRRRRKVQGDSREIPTTSPNTERSLCHPIWTPGLYSVSRTCCSRSGGNPANAAASLADGKQKCRHILGFLQAAAVEIVAPSERHDAALAEEALEFELLERQAGDLTDQPPLLVLRDQIGLIFKAGRQQRRRRVEQVCVGDWHR